MKLTPAEDWLKLAFNGQPALLEQPQIREPSLKFYRQIQANAIRWAGYISRSAADARDFERLANQLDPLPEVKVHPYDDVCPTCAVGFRLPSGVCDHCNVSFPELPDR